MGRESTAEGVDANGPGLRKEFDGRGIGGKDVSGACVFVGELVSGVMGGSAIRCSSLYSLMMDWALPNSLELFWEDGTECKKIAEV